MPDEIEGIYSTYLTGKTGNGFAMFVIRSGKLVGADPLGVKFDGSYEREPNGQGHVGRVTVTVPSDGTTIQGASAGPDGLTYEVPLALPRNFSSQEFVQIDTPLGPVNVKLVKLRSLDV